MKFVFGALFLASALFAQSDFVEGKVYSCVTTKAIKDGKSKDIEQNMAKQRPFEFSIVEDKLVSSEKTIFTYMVEKNEAKIYANDEFMISLSEGGKMDLTSKNRTGKTQYQFKCSVKADLKN